MNKGLILSIVCFLCACTDSGVCVIEGMLPGDGYDNEAVYWVPMESEYPMPVDSTHINKNTFRLAISPRNLNKMGIIRLRPVHRIALQEILVFTEAGTTLQVKLDSISSASGTPANNALQAWKERIHTYNREVNALRRQLSDITKNRPEKGEADETAIKAAIENATATYHNDVYRLILANRTNAAGKFLFSRHKSAFTPEQIQASGME